MRQVQEFRFMRTKTIIFFSVLSAAAVGCGDDGGGSNMDNPDAGPSADGAPTPDAAPTLASCGLRLNYEYSYYNAGKLVVFNGPDGSVIGTEVTDVDGLASRDDCMVGTTITVDLASGGGKGGARYAALVSVAGVNPGDTLVFPPNEQPDNYVGGLEFTPDDGGFPGAVSYFFTNDCDSSGFAVDGGPYEFPIYEHCLGTDQNVDLLGLAYDGSGNIIGYSSSKGVAAVPDGVATTTMSTWANVSAETDLVVSAVNVPLDQDSTWLEVEQGRDRVGFNGDDIGFSPDLDGTYEWTYPAYPDDFIDTLWHSWGTEDFAFYDNVYNSDFFDYRYNDVRGAPTKAPTADFSELLPAIVAWNVSSAGGVVSSEWVLTSSPTGIDGGAAAFWFDTSVGVYGDWYVLFPAPTSNAVTLPQLPKEYFGTFGEFDVTPWDLVFFDYSFTDYRGILQSPFNPMGVNGGPVVADPSDLATTKRVTGIYNDD